MATRRSDGRYVTSLQVGKRRRYFYGSTDQAAEQKKSTFLEGPKKPNLRPGSLNEFIETTWWPRVQHLKEATQRRYRDVLKGHVIPPIGNLLLAEIAYPHCQAIIDCMREQGLSPKSIELARTVLGQILRLAARLSLIEQNPVPLTIAPRVAKGKLRRDLTIERVKKLLAAAAGTRMEGPVWAAACLGLRRGEVCGLKVTDVDLEAGLLTLRATRDKWGEFPLKGKTHGEHRAISLPRPLLAKVLSYSRRSLPLGDRSGDREGEGVGDGGSGSGPSGKPLSPAPEEREVGERGSGSDPSTQSTQSTPIPSPNPQSAIPTPQSLYLFLDGARPIHPDRITKDMPALCVKAGVPPMTFHDLRAAAASNLRSLGVDPWTIMAILGHSSIDMTTIYQDLRAKDQQAALAQLAAALE